MLIDSGSGRGGVGGVAGEAVLMMQIKSYASK